MLTLKETFYLERETNNLIKTIEEAYPKLSEQGLSAGQPSATIDRPGVAQNTPNTSPGQSAKTLPVNKQQTQQPQKQSLDPKLAKLGAWLLRLSTDEMSKSHVLQILNKALEKFEP